MSIETLTVMLLLTSCGGGRVSHFQVIRHELDIMHSLLKCYLQNGNKHDKNVHVLVVVIHRQYMGVVISLYGCGL